MRKLLLLSILSLAAPAVAFADAAPPTPAATTAPAPGGAAPAGHSCGEMMASKAVLPTKMAEVMTSVADMMDAHAAYMTAGKTKEGAKEAAGMKKLAAEHRALAKAFTKTAADMAKASSWPAAPHDMAAMMADPKLTASMQRVLATHKEMVALMQKEVAEMEAHSKHAMK